MGQHYWLIVFHDDLRRDTEMVSGLKEAFNLVDLPQIVTRKPSLAAIRDAFVKYRDDMVVEWAELTEQSLRLVMRKRHPAKANTLLKYVELAIDQHDLDKGLKTRYDCSSQHTWTAVNFRARVDARQRGGNVCQLHGKA